MRYNVQLRAPAQDMAREEITKQVVFLSPAIENVAFSDTGDQVYFDAPEILGETLRSEVQTLATRIERALRNIQRKTVFRSAEAANPQFAPDFDSTDIRFLGTGQVLLAGLPLRLFRYFDRVFEEFGQQWNPTPLAVPTLIPTHVLARCDYFRSFPHYVTFVTHLQEDARVIDDFRRSHHTAEDLNANAMQAMTQPDTCLTPALCYHVYHLTQESTIPASGTVYGMCGKCFRFESRNVSDMRRLWEFTMRELVFLGSRQAVTEAKERSVEIMADFLRSHRLAAEIRTASDPFFIAPEAVAKTFFQLSSESKLEVSLILPEGERTAVASHNYHSDFFGTAFNTKIEGGGPMHSVCVAFGLERWVYGFLRQHGSNPAKWPDPVRNAAEFTGLQGRDS